MTERFGPLGAVAVRELRSLFCSPLAWTLLAIVQAVLGYVFLLHLDLYFDWQPRLPDVPNAPGLTAIVVAPTFKIAGIVLLLVAPLVTMRMIAEERRTGTMTLLMSAPISMTEIVLGKFAAAMTFFAVQVAVIALMPLSLLLGGTLDFGLVMAGLVGLVLLSASFVATGLFMSTLTTQPAIAAVATFGLLFGLWVLGWTGGDGDGGLPAAIGYLSLTAHLDALLRGVFDTRDIAYYLLFTVLFLVLAIRRLDAARTPV